MLGIQNIRAPFLVALMGAVPAVPGAFVLAGILHGPGNVGLLAGIVNPHYFQAPLAISLHIASGILFCALAPLQFSYRIRTRFPRWHRIGGRVAILAGVMFGITALPMLGPAPEGVGWLRYGGLAFAAVGFSASVLLAFATIRRRDIRAHRTWALRAVAIGLMGASRVLLETFAWLILGNVSEFTGGVVLWLAIIMNLLIVELHLRRNAPRKITINI